MRVPSPWQPIRRKLPLLISTLLVAVVVVMSGMAYRQLEATLLDAARDRVANGAQRLADVFTGSAWGQRVRAQRLASDPTIVRYLSRPTESARIAAEETLDGERTTDQRVVAISLWTNHHGRTLVVGNTVFADSGFSAADEVPHDSAAGGSWIGPFIAVGDSAIYHLIAPVFGRAGETLGFLVESRRVSTQSERVTRALIGDAVVLMFGNATGGVWTDEHAKRVAGPSMPVSTGVPVEFRGPHGDVRLGAVAAVPPTPWLIWVEIPRSAVLAPARHFLVSMGAAALLIIAVGVVAAWLLSNHITAPLDEITRAAEDLAGGDYARRVSLVRADELGRLATAFNTMAQQVQDSRTVLEERVAERTRELQEALEGLRRAQDELVRRERLAILGQLAGGVGHELRNPLGVMTNAVYYLGVVLADAPPTVHDYLAILRTQIGLSEKIVTDLLDFARVKSPQREWIVLEDLVAQQLGRACIPAGIRVERELPADLPLVSADCTQIGQVVLNLITNAIQAMVGSRSCEEATGTLLLRGRVLDEGRVALEVRDTGPGVLPEHLEQIFEPLFTTKARGIGLGLAVSRTLARANGGDLTVSSRPGSGASFSLVMLTSAPTPA
ncbi:MAG TPA: ATP-binding protein [Gemmatimonadaceae bacterium]